MLKFQINVDSKHIAPDNKKKYSVKQLASLKETLNLSKNKIDAVWANKKALGFWREFDPFKREKQIVAKLGDTYNVTNAWLKCYELLIEFSMVPEKPNGKKFVHFDNAAFPGSFIVSTHHFVKTHRDWKDDEFMWYGSSLIGGNELDAEPLEDKYKLYSNYPEHWVMTKENNGDVLNIEAQTLFHERLGGKVDLYTSDIGFDVSSDYNNQELMQLPVNIGQILSGLITLKKGGSFMTKQYTTFDASTLSIMYATATFFDEFYLCKPYSSREANSETYLIGIGFKAPVSLDHVYIQAMFDRISGKIPAELPLFYHTSYPKSYLKSIISASTKLFGRQIEKIEDDVRKSLAGAMDNNGKPWLHHSVKAFKRESNPLIEQWHLKMDISPIRSDRKLQMIDVFHQS